MIEIQDRIWQFIQESAGTVENPDLDRVGQIRRRADGFMRLIQNEQLSTEGQILILLQIYQRLLQLQLGKLLLQLETVSSNQPTEAITANESLSLTAISAKTLRSISIPAHFRPLIIRL